MLVAIRGALSVIIESAVGVGGSDVLQVLQIALIRNEAFLLPRRLGTRTVRWLHHEVADYIPRLEVVEYFGTDG